MVAGCKNPIVPIKNIKIPIETRIGYGEGSTIWNL